MIEDETPAKKTVWELLREAPRPSKRVAFASKRFDGATAPELAMRVLTQQEAMGAAIAAERATRAQMKMGSPGDIGFDEFYARAVCVETLFRACVDVEDERRAAWATPEILRQQLTTEQCATLLEIYTDIQNELTDAPRLLEPLRAPTALAETDTLIAHAQALAGELPDFVDELALEGNATEELTIAESARDQLSATVAALRELSTQLATYEPLLEQLSEHAKNLAEAQVPA